MRMNHSWLYVPITLAVFITADPAFCAPGPVEKSTVVVECVKGSGLIQVNIENHRKIGNVLIEVRNNQGQLVYREEGKAMTGELVRRLDKGMFANGPATVTVESRDFRITREIEIR